MSPRSPPPHGPPSRVFATACGEIDFFTLQKPFYLARYDGMGVNKQKMLSELLKNSALNGLAS